MRALLYVFIFAMGGLSLATVATSQTLHDSPYCSVEMTQPQE